MNYEKRYKDALERAKGTINYYKEHNRGDESAIEDLEIIFPELQESEDEKIRKELIDAINGLWVNDALPLPLSVGRKDKWIAWLEKQGEQKPTWSEGDETLLYEIVDYFNMDNALRHTENEIIDWLKSLKERLS